MSVQIIEKNGNPEWAVIPYEGYQRLVAEAEMLEDIRHYDEVKSALTNEEEELIPSEVTYAVLDGENPIRVLPSTSRRVALIVSLASLMPGAFPGIVHNKMPL